MANLPESWNLTTRLNGAGKAEVWGKDDNGADYRVRTCDNDGLTEVDVAEIAAVDRERTTAKEFVGNLMADGAKRESDRDSAYFDDLTEAAGPVVHAGLEKKGSTLGYSRVYAQNFDRWLSSIGE
jgi:hypothetical protein